MCKKVLDESFGKSRNRWFMNISVVYERGRARVCAGVCAEVYRRGCAGVYRRVYTEVNAIVHCAREHSENH